MQSLIRSLVPLVIIGIVSSLISGYFILQTFRSGDCDGGCNTGQLLVVIAGLFVAFMLAGCFLLLRKHGQRPLSLARLAVMASAIVIPTGAMFLWKQAEPTQLHTNQDDSFMLIAERDVPILGLQAGQRCIFSDIRCESDPPHIPAICGSGAITIPEPDWAALKRLPEEDFGVPPSSSVSAFPRSCSKHSAR